MGRLDNLHVETSHLRIDPEHPVAALPRAWLERLRRPERVPATPHESADATETAEAWKTALLHEHGPVALVLTRQGLPVLDRAKYPPASNLSRGAYSLTCADSTPDIIIIATGSEVHLALKAAESLGGKGVSARVVSMPSWELFEEQDQRYKDAVLPPDVRVRLSIEAGSTVGWHRYVGMDGDAVGIERFGASAPAKTLFEKFGFTVENITSRALALLQRKKSALP